MVEFNTSYFHTLDKPKGASISEFGTSAKMGDIIDALKSEISVGAKHVELGFTGKGKGSLGQMQTTPEMFDKLKREEVRQLAKINGVTLSTHATLGISGIAGMTEQGQGFSERARAENLNELKRTVDFAADTARGGAIVVHTNEFQREVKDKNFVMGTGKEEVVHLVDTENGKVFGFKKNDTLHMPKWKKDDKENFLDSNGKIIEKEDNYADRVLIVDKEGNPEWDDIPYEKFAENIKKWNEYHPKEKEKNPEKEFLFQQHLQKVQSESPRAMQYLEQAKDYQKLYAKMEQDFEAFKELEKSCSKERIMEMIIKEYGEHGKKMVAKYHDENIKPSEILKKEAQHIKGEASYLMEGYIGFDRQRKEIYKMYNKVDLIENYGVKKSAETLADAAIYAFQIEKQKKIDKPMFIAPENMMAEWGYGSHPDELKNIVQKSREKMEELLLARHLVKDKEEAKKVAKEHIKATFDIGHANTWAKYFDAENPNLTPEERKKKFDKWLLDKIKELSDAKVLGHIHLSDNFGYYDEHLAPGMGNAPMEKFMEIIKKDPNYEGKVIVEWGSQPVEQRSESMLGAWAKLASSPIYRVEGMATQKWNDIENSGYFGRMSSPANIVGNYGSSMGKDWALWSYSEAPIE
jgi:sugar phosphate isomerase/epimerase